MAQKTVVKPRKPLAFSKTVVTEFLAPVAAEMKPLARQRAGGGRPRVHQAGSIKDGEEAASVAPLRTAPPPPTRSPNMAGLVREWLGELKVMNRSPRTIEWYQQKFDWYLQHEGGPTTLDGLTKPRKARRKRRLMEPAYARLRSSSLTPEA